MSVLLKVNDRLWINPSHIIAVKDDQYTDKPINIITVRNTSDEVYDFELTREEWTAIEPLVTLPARAAGSTPTPQSVTRQAVDEIIADEEPVIQWARVIEVEKDQFYSKTSRGHRDMWRLRTSDGRQVNIFDHADPLRDQKSLLKEAGYWDIFSAMDMSQVDRWDTHPIQLDIVADGAFWKVMNFALRPDSAGPDAPLIVSEEALMADYAKKQEGWHSELEAEDIARAAAPRDDSDDEFDDDFIDDDDPPYDNDDDDLGDDDDPIEPDTDLALLRSVVESGNFVILDTETTGLNEDAEICQIAIIDSQGNTLLDTLVRPQKPIPAKATSIHGITNDMVKPYPDWLNINEAVWTACEGKTVIVYNAEYDFKMIIQSEKACEPFALSDWHTVKRACAMLAYGEYRGVWNDYFGNWKWHKLSEASASIGYTLPEGMKAHSALADCLMTLAVCRKLAGL